MQSAVLVESPGRHFNRSGNETAGSDRRRSVSSARDEARGGSTDNGLGASLHCYCKQNKLLLLLLLLLLQETAEDLMLKSVPETGDIGVMLANGTVKIVDGKRRRRLYAQIGA